MCRFGMRTGPPRGSVGHQLVRKPTRWASSSPDVLNEDVPEMHQRSGRGAGLSPPARGPAGAVGVG
eukprot:13890115-Alexandrium_andersonii.AAC.1